VIRARGGQRAREGLRMSSELDQLCMNTIRFLAVDAVQKANSRHPGMPVFPPDAKCMATRVASGVVMNAIAQRLPALRSQAARRSA
jgi:transketolase